jgi:hypothetical protein
MFPEYGCKDCGKDRQLYAIQTLGGKTRSGVRSERERRKGTDALVCCLRRLVIISLQRIYFRLCILTSNNSSDLTERPFHYFSIPTPIPPHLRHNWVIFVPRHWLFNMPVTEVRVLCCTASCHNCCQICTPSLRSSFRAANRRQSPDILIRISVPRNIGSYEITLHVKLSSDGK